ncbi:oxidoreductase [Gammaproteobacteria bacterium ESL0073]|nr:oxidoreductase [Gammaproteobacteria bacterium ESL0073]
MQIIKDAQVVNDNWQLLSIETTLDDISAEDNVILPLSLWLANKNQLENRQEKTGVWLSSAEEIESIAENVAAIPLIALEFPSFTDGRHYSSARILRERYHYQGEIRAIGDVLKDQIFAMHRCGFNSFVIKQGKDINNALLGLTDFSETYQAAVVQPLPLFKRR